MIQPLARRIHSSPDSVQPTLSSMRRLIRREADSLLRSADQLSSAAMQAARLTARCEGAVIVTGVGKAGLVGQKLVATLASTGTPAHFLHPAEAVHGDLGRVRSGDLVWAISNSGRSDEVLRIAEALRSQAGKMITITAAADNPLAQAADVAVTFGRHDEVDPHGLAPTASTAVMMAIGDAIAITASEMRGFQRSDFAKFHPGGSLGKKLQSAAEMMRAPDQCRTANRDASIRIAVTTATGTGRCTGAVMVVDENNKLCGIFTDSDLARLLARDDMQSLDTPIAQRMTAPCRHVSADTNYRDVVELMQQHRISELPVVDANGVVIGMIDRTDIGLDQPAWKPASDGIETNSPSGFRVVGMDEDAA